MKSTGILNCRAVLRSCYDLFANSTNKRNGILVVPILSGITYVNICGDLLKVSRKTKPIFISLAGMQETEGLVVSFYDTFGRQTHLKNLDRIMATFGGFPRLYTWLLDEIRNQNIEEPVGSQTAGRLYNGVKKRYSDKYPITIWIQAFAQKTGNKEDKRISERTIGIAKSHLKRIHTIAVSGVTIHQDAKVDASIAIGMTYQELSAVGLFTLRPDPGNPDMKGNIIIPLVVLDAYCEHTGICAPDTLSPFAYSWQSMEHVAMWTLRCFWNSFYFIGQGKIYVDQLRPGALHNNNGWLDNLPTLKVDKELPRVVSLASEFQGDLSTTFKTQGDGQGPEFTVSDRSIFTMMPNPAGNDGGALLLPLAILNQTKSLQLDTPNSRITQQVVNDLVKKQQAAGDKFDFGTSTSIIYDLFTNKLAGPKLDASKLPDNTFLCTADNFATVVGPVFKDTLMLFKPFFV